MIDRFALFSGCTFSYNFVPILGFDIGSYPDFISVLAAPLCGESVVGLLQAVFAAGGLAHLLCNMVVGDLISSTGWAGGPDTRQRVKQPRGFGLPEGGGALGSCITHHIFASFRPNCCTLKATGFGSYKPSHMRSLIFPMSHYAD